MASTLSSDIFNSHNFFNNSSLVAWLIDRCGIGPNDLVLEIGPGRGVITAQLARRCKRVLAIEKDPALSAFLRQRFAEQPNVTIYTGDFLEQPLPTRPYKVFSNIPFNLTSAIVTRLTETPNPPQEAALWMQKEAALMYLGKPRESLRSVLLKPWFKPEIGYHFRRDDFTPIPKVDITLLQLHKLEPPLVSKSDRQKFRDFVVHGFTFHRPEMGGFLKYVFAWKQARQVARALDIDLKSTSTELRLEHWLGLFEYFKSIGSDPARRAIAGSEWRLRRQQARLDKLHRTRRKM
jgi:23S rRNA (adenine-N6)-dimethyltransferase